MVYNLTMSEVRHNREHSSSDDIEIVLLRSELSEIFHTHANVADLWTDENFDQPTEIILGGTFHFTNADSTHNIEVQIRQRIDERGIDYLIVVGEAGEYEWYQVADTGAWRTDNGEQSLGSREAEAIRMLIRPDSTTWTFEEARNWAMMGGMYEMADRRAHRI